MRRSSATSASSAVSGSSAGSEESAASKSSAGSAGSRGSVGSAGSAASRSSKGKGKGKGKGGQGDRSDGGSEGESESDNAQEGFCPGSRLELAAEALKRYDSDPLYRTLFERTGQLFAEQLRQDRAHMRAGHRIGLCAKWCPLLYHSFDRRTLICESIGRWLFPGDLPEFAGITERQYAYRCRDKLRKLLSELKEYMKVPERLMCQGRWQEILYNRVPATCMKTHAKHFENHDPERFAHYLENLKSGKVKAKTGALLPHQVLLASRSEDQVDRDVAQSQWEALVAKTGEDGQLGDSISICDVSGSMDCSAGAKVSCMDVAISMSLLLAECAQGAFARKLITFHEEPQLVSLPESKQLAELDKFTKALSWGGATNFNKVFGLLLRFDPPPKRIFVFSDMQFSSASGSTTDFRAAQAMYQAKGLQLPQIIFWNLSKSQGAPVLASDKNVAMLSGFSPMLLRALLTRGKMDPLTILNEALDTPLLRKLRVVYDKAEAVELFFRRQPGHQWLPEPARPPEPLEPLEPKANAENKKKKKRSCSVETHSLGSVSCKEAIAALIGREGKGMKALRKNLEKLLLSMLAIPKLRLWLDLKTHVLPPPHLEGGMLLVTASARVSHELLTAMLAKLDSHASTAMRNAEKRAMQPSPKMRKRENFLKRAPRPQLPSYKELHQLAWERQQKHRKKAKDQDWGKTDRRTGRSSRHEEHRSSVANKQKNRAHADHSNEAN